MVISSGFENTALSVISLKRINIIAGPNNSGKSTILKDIEEWFNTKNPQLKLLRNLEVTFSDNPNEYREFEKDILEFEDGDRTGQGENQLIWLYKQHIFEESGVSQCQYKLIDIKMNLKREILNILENIFSRIL
jgi:ATPase subunit of ABC transporter with duplicated ATPase domains